MFRFFPAILAAAMTLPAAAEVLRFDFGENDNLTTEPGWNNVTYAAGNPAPNLTTVINSAGETATGVGLVFDNQFFNDGTTSEEGTVAPTGDAAAYPASATVDYLFGHTETWLTAPPNPVSIFRLTGLDTNQTYNLTFFASRMGVDDNRETAYTVTGLNTANGLIQPSNNDGNTLQLIGITPDANGDITISATVGANNDNEFGFYYINTLEVATIPEPSALIIMAAASALLIGRRRR